MNDIFDNYQENIETVDAQVNLDAKLKDAMEFINYNVHQGVYDESVIEGMTAEQIIDFASREEDRALYAYESQQEEGLI